MASVTKEIAIDLTGLTVEQQRVWACKEKRIILQVGRRGGKTILLARRGVFCFLQGKRYRYAVPVGTQLNTWWYEVTRLLKPALDAGQFYINETEHVVEKKGTKQRLEGRTAWNVGTLRGDYCDELHLDEYQAFNEDAWDYAGQPCLADTDGVAIFAFTPPRMGDSEGISRAHDPMHASKMYRAAVNGEKGNDWAAFHWTTLDNTFLSREGVARLTAGMSRQAYRLEILAMDDDTPDNALVFRAWRPDSQMIEPIPLPQSWPVYTGHDFGSANPAAVFLTQNPATGEFFVFAEYLPGGGLSVAQHVEAFKKLAAGRNVVHRAGGNHQESEIRQAYAAHGWYMLEPITPQGRPASVGDRIERLRALMETNKIFVFRTCSRLIAELANYSFKTGGVGVITDEIAQKAKYHLLDSLGYSMVHTVYETAGQQLQVVYTEHLNRGGLPRVPRDTSGFRIVSTAHA